MAREVSRILTLRFRLLDPSDWLLPLLGSRFALEVAIGVNGKVWVKTPEIKHTIAATRCIEAIDDSNMTEKDLVKFLNGIEL